jgi:cell division protein FtsI/penicillin-binding protein 2
VASHVIGYIGRISQKDAEIIDDMEDSANYNGTDYIGKEGLEKSYEKILHGRPGLKRWKYPPVVVPCAPYRARRRRPVRT